MPANSLISARPLLASRRSSPQPPDRASIPWCRSRQGTDARSPLAQGDESGQLAGAADRGPDSPRIEDRQPVAPAKSVSTLRQARPPGTRAGGWAARCRPAVAGQRNPAESRCVQFALFLAHPPARVTQGLPRDADRRRSSRRPGAGGAGPRPGSAAAAHARSRNMPTGRLESFRRGPGFPTGPRAGRRSARGSRARRGESRSAGSGAARLRR